MLACFGFGMWFLIVAPPLWFTFKWWRAGQGLRPSLASWGAGLFLLSFYALPWLNLQPLKHIGLDWIVDVAPPLLESSLRQLGLESLGSVSERVSSIELFFSPPGWLTLIMVAPILVSLGVIATGSLSFILAQVVASQRNASVSAILLMLTSALHLLVLFYYLPDIDGLGERAFPSVFTLAVPALGAHLEWLGPLTMLVALCLMFFAGAKALYDV